jgi:hypothetical protein
LTYEGVINPWELRGRSDRGNQKIKEGTVKRSLLKVLMVMALGAVICLPGVAAAGITLNFADFVAWDQDDFSKFAWGGVWTVAGGTVSAGNGATISLIDNTSAFTFDGAEFALYGATSLSITGKQVGDEGIVEFLTPDLNSSLQPYTFKNYPPITLLTFKTTTNGETGGNFKMNNFVDAPIPLPPSALLLGSGLLGLVGLGWRRRKNS